MSGDHMTESTHPYSGKPDVLLGDLRGGMCNSGLCRQLRAVAADEIERWQTMANANAAAFNEIKRTVVRMDAEIERLRNALRYWLPDETMIPAGHEVAWNEHVALIPEHRRTDSIPGEP